MERLQKVIASSGYTSRRKAEELIEAGKVFVNGECIKQMGYKVSGSDDIMVDGILLKQEKLEYYIINKPRGYICAVSDDKGRKVVSELIDTKARIYPVGRLDYDTTGLLLMTNDGALANKLEHPSFGVGKTYLAKINGKLSMEELHKLKSGIVLDGIMCRAEKVKIKKYDKEKDTSLVLITIHVGINHVVKRMFMAVSHDVLKLRRESIGFLSLGNLKSGEYRALDQIEIRKLKSI